MDMIFEYLNNTLGDNYIYIIGIGAILLFILVGFLAGRKDSPKQKPLKAESMANINEIKTGEINQVAANLNQEKIDPIDIVESPTTDALVVDQEPIVPVSGGPLSEDQVNLTTDTPGTLRLDAFAQTTNVSDENLVTPGMQAPNESQSRETESNQISDVSKLNNFEKPAFKKPLNVDDLLGKMENTSSVVPDSAPEVQSQPEIIDVVNESNPSINTMENANVDYNPYISETPINAQPVNENLVEEESLNQNKEEV